MGLARVWIETLDDGLVRADQVVEVLAHQTAAFAGKPARWLIDVVIPVSQGAGASGQWHLAASHRTLMQTGTEPRGAAHRLVELLCRLDATDAAGIVRAERAQRDEPSTGSSATSTSDGIAFRFHALPSLGA
ncbi:MAG: hypothetical protein QOE59_893 [Actinomycetota bacterium]|nr:hypothetical protein [Actinomycetota bacterium]